MTKPNNKARRAANRSAAAAASRNAAATVNAGGGVPKQLELQTPKPSSEGKRPTLTFRCRAALQEKLQAAAADADRSVSEEVERRLERSFEDVDLIAAIGNAVRAETNAGIERLVGGKENFDLLVQLSHGVVIAQHMTGKHWTVDPQTRELVYKQILNSLPFILNNPAPRYMSPSEQSQAWDQRKVDTARMQEEGLRREREQQRGN